MKNRRGATDLTWSLIALGVIALLIIIAWATGFLPKINSGAKQVSDAGANLCTTVAEGLCVVPQNPSSPNCPGTYCSGNQCTSDNSYSVRESAAPCSNSPADWLVSPNQPRICCKKA